MNNTDSVHSKVQEQINGFCAKNTVSEMTQMQSATSNVEETALKWIALAVIHGVEQDAEQILLSRDRNRNFSVTAQYRKSGLPSPGFRIGENIMRTIQHLIDEGNDRQQPLLSRSVNGSGLKLKLKIKNREGNDEIFFQFTKSDN